MTPQWPREGQPKEEESSVDLEEQAAASWPVASLDGSTASDVDSTCAPRPSFGAGPLHGHGAGNPSNNQQQWHNPAPIPTTISTAPDVVNESKQRQGERRHRFRRGMQRSGRSLNTLSEAQQEQEQEQEDDQTTNCSMSDFFNAAMDSMQEMECEDDYHADSAASAISDARSRMSEFLDEIVEVEQGCQDCQEDNELQQQQQQHHEVLWKPLSRLSSRRCQVCLLVLLCALIGIVVAAVVFFLAVAGRADTDTAPGSNVSSSSAITRGGDDPDLALFPVLSSPSAPQPQPTTFPSALPTPFPSHQITDTSSIASSIMPSTNGPTSIPTAMPTEATTDVPTTTPSDMPTSIMPTSRPTVTRIIKLETPQPTTAAPTVIPTEQTTTSDAPTTKPTLGPTPASPSAVPTSTTKRPTAAPTKIPTTRSPTAAPTTTNPTFNPSAEPTPNPTTVQPTNSPTQSPTLTITLPPTAKPVAALPLPPPPSDFGPFNCQQMLTSGSTHYGKYFCIYQNFPFTWMESSLSTVCPTASESPTPERCFCLVAVRANLLDTQMTACQTCELAAGDGDGNDNGAYYSNYDCSNVLTGGCVGRDVQGNCISSLP